MEKIFTSTGVKFIHHPDVVRKFKESLLASPVSLQMAPTSVCNLKCEFCSNVNREKHEFLSKRSIIQIIHELFSKGLKTVEWTGGGDPTLHPYINDVIDYAASLDLQQGFITNGIELNRLTRKNLENLTWLRVSMNCLDYIDEVKIPSIPGALGFSYVYNSKTSEDVLERLDKHVEEYDPVYVRVVPDCQTSLEEQERSNKVLVEEIARWGPPYFYQAKMFSKPKRCWWGYFKPFVLHDGWVYPCSSVVLNENSDRKFHEKYRWVKMEQIKEKYELEAIPFDSSNCSHCVFRPQNDMIDNLIHPNGMENFI